MNACMPRRRAHPGSCLTLCGVAAGLLVATLASSADEQAFLRCGAIEADDERLACYDEAYREAARTVLQRQPGSGIAPAGDALRTAAEADAAAASTQVSAPVPGDRAHRSAPVAAAPDEAGFGQRRRAEPPPESMRAAVERVARTPAGRLLFYLDNGQTWQQVERKRLDLPALPAAIEIRRAALGSFKLNFQGHSGWTRVKRIR